MCITHHATLPLSAGGKQWVFEPSITPLPARRLSPKNVPFLHCAALYHTQKASHPQATEPSHTCLLPASAARGFSYEGPSCLWQGHYNDLRQLDIARWQSAPLGHLSLPEMGEKAAWASDGRSHGKMTLIKREKQEGKDCSGDVSTELGVTHSSPWRPCLHAWVNPHLGSGTGTFPHRMAQDTHNNGGHWLTGATVPLPVVVCYCSGSPMAWASVSKAAALMTWHKGVVLTTDRWKPAQFSTKRKKLGNFKSWASTELEECKDGACPRCCTFQDCGETANTGKK